MVGAPMDLTSAQAYDTVDKKLVKCSLLEVCVPRGGGQITYSKVESNMLMVGTCRLNRTNIYLRPNGLCCLPSLCILHFISLLFFQPSGQNRVGSRNASR